MTAGVIPDTSIDTLLMYGYAQEGVDKVKLEIDKDEKNNGKSPSVKYLIKLTPSSNLKWKALKKAENIQNPLLRKAAILALTKLGVPFDLDKRIIYHAKDYLPDQFQVSLEIVETI